MVSLFLLLGYIVDLFAALYELASASARTLLKLASSVRALLKPYGDRGDTLNFARARAHACACADDAKIVRSRDAQCNTKGTGKRGHIVADTLLLMTFPCARKLGNICCGYKMFLNKIRNIFCVPDTKFVSATNVARAGKRGNICDGNNVSATMCPRLPVP